MPFISNQKGFTLIEMMIAIALTALIASASFSLLIFARRSMVNTECYIAAVNDATLAMMDLERDIRRAKRAVYNGVSYKGVTAYDGGMRIDIYADLKNDGVIKLIRYKLDGDSLKRGVASLGSEPTTWKTVVYKLQNDKLSPKVPIFTIDEGTVNIKLLVIDESNMMATSPVVVDTTLTVRSKGVMD